MRVRCTAIALAAVLLVAVTGISAAQADGNQFHIYLVVWRGETDVEHGFRAHLFERGIPARYTLRNINQDRSRIPEIVAEIRAAKPDLVHTFGTSATLGIFGPHTDATPGAHVEEIPGVFSIVAYPIEGGVVKQFDPPARSITGTAFLAPIDSQIDAILAYRQIDTLGVIFNSLERNSVINVKALKEGAEARGITLLESPVPLDADGKPDAARLDQLVDDLVRQGADFLYMGPDSFVTVNSEQISVRAAEQGVPTFAGTGATFSRSRAMLGLVSRYYLIGKLAGAQAERILVNGENPEQIPVASLARFALLIRMPVAVQLGIYPPMELLPIAQVVE
jgi:putative ABC transport system substrate-binding protein